MAQNNSANLNNLSVKPVPVASDLAIILDNASNNNPKEATLSSFPASTLTNLIYPSNISGNYYPAGLTPNNSLQPTPGGTISTGTLYLIPFIQPLSSTYTKIATQVSSGVASSNIVMGIYASNTGNNAPTGSPITNSSSGSISTASSGLASYTFASAITLAQGIYWAAISGSSSSLQFYNNQSSPQWGVISMGCYTLGTNAAIETLCYTQSFGYSATLPAIGTLSPSAFMYPLVYLVAQ